MGHRFRRYFVLLLLSFIMLAHASSSAQGAKVHTAVQRDDSPSDRDQARRREQWFSQGRVVPRQSAAPLRYRAHLQKMRSRAARLAERARGVNRPFSAGATATSVWTPLGPAPLNSDASGFGFQDYGAVSGRATAVAVDPADPSGNTVYVGGAYGGVWKSENAAASNPASVIWTPLTDTQATLAVGSIAIQPGTSVVLVGTGETDSSLDSYYGLGILRSADGGNSWTLSTEDTGGRQFAGLGFSKIAFSTLQPESVVAAAAGATQGVIDNLENPVSANRGLYHSNDGGQNWTYSSVQDGGVTIAPDSATSVVFTTVAGVGVFFAALRFHGFYSSPDGAHWTRLSNQPGGLSTSLCPPNPASQASPTCPIYRGELAVVPGRAEMYAWYVDASDGDGGIWQTSDGGTHWKKISGAGITNCGDAFGGCGTSQGSYNLELAAVPNRDATDLYAGAINIYKCTISRVFPSCDPNFVPTPPADATFQNLTHVYGCPPDFGAIAHVHPDQHGIAFMQVSGPQVVMYFANDGGIYRALDGYSGLTKGSCNDDPNQFESLNQTLGSMTQFVSFSQHPTDPGTILGGSQDNGSPATNMGPEISTQWLNVNSGDGGYNAINPANPTEWFTANTDVSIQRCTSGIACHAQDYTEVVGNATVGGDFGAFYTPYILDPQNSSELIVGTCRVWRGTTTGENFSVLSVDFETRGDGSCLGSEVNLVRSLAAGGIKDTNGFSNVIYAGTSGFGPLWPGGHIWVTTNASAGPGSWIDRTGLINPGGFPLSGVAIDSSDATGNTAYVTIMGFGVPHVMKTINAGVLWADFSGELTNALPDAPANAILVDPGSTPDNGTVYVATDVGVFSSSTGSASWTEVGPAPDPLSNQQTGYLPNVAVTALGMFNFDGTKKLRASTYGRGMWEVTLLAAPDFAFDIPNSSSAMTVFPGQQAVFSGTLLALDGYNSTIDLTCAAAVTPAPPACLPAPTSLTPAIAPGTSFTINASSPTAADYLFNVTGEGSDSNRVLRESLLTLHVVDFNLTPPSPASLSVSQSAVSNPVSFQVTAAGSFHGTVELSCAGLPAGAACSFLPSSSVNPTAGAWAAATMTVSTLANTPPGNYAVAIVATVTRAPSPKTQMLSLTVNPPGASGDFALSVSKASQTAPVDGSAIFNAAITSSAGYTSVVDLSCGSGAPLNCEPSPASLTPTASGTAFTVRAGADVVRNYHFSVVGTGRDSAHTTHSQSLVLNVVFDFAVNNQSGSQSVPSGQQAHYNLDVRPLGNSAVFPDNVNLSCSGLPPLSTCSFSPSQVASGAGDNNVVLTIATTATITASTRLARIRSTTLLLIWPLTGVAVVFAGFTRGSRTKKNIVHSAGLLLIVSLGILQSGCGGLSGASGSGQPGTPPGAYQVTVAATLNTASGPLSRSVQIMLTVQ